jgi:hypothetical protein
MAESGIERYQRPAIADVLARSGVDTSEPPWRDTPSVRMRRCGSHTGVVDSTGGRKRRIGEAAPVGSIDLAAFDEAVGHGYH